MVYNVPNIFYIYNMVIVVIHHMLYLYIHMQYLICILKHQIALKTTPVIQNLLYSTYETQIKQAQNIYVKIEVWKQICHINVGQKMQGGTTLLSDKMHFMVEVFASVTLGTI